MHEVSFSMDEWPGFGAGEAGIFSCTMADGALGWNLLGDGVDEQDSWSSERTSGIHAASLPNLETPKDQTSQPYEGGDGSWGAAGTQGHHRSDLGQSQGLSPLAPWGSCCMIANLGGGEGGFPASSKPQQQIAVLSPEMVGMHCSPWWDTNIADDCMSILFLCSRPSGRVGQRDGGENRDDPSPFLSASPCDRSPHPSVAAFSISIQRWLGLHQKRFKLLG
jgi:hypothetical protein